jgi:Glycosyl hydrolase family 76
MLRPFWPLIWWSVAVGFLFAAHDVCSAQANSDAATQFATWGAETLDAIRRDFWIDERGMYAEKASAEGGHGPSTNPPLTPPDQGGEKREPAFMWSAGVQLSALAAAARVDSAKYTAPLAAYADVLETYWIEHDGIGGYSVLPNQRVADRYYDDNAWIVLGQVETAAATGDAKYLERAAATHRFVMSGEDDRLGGGVYWRENRRGSKNTCSNAPAIVGALLLHRATKEPKYLESAERLYKWTQEHLQDPEDGLYWDNISVRRGRLDRRKYSYNSALMIRANCLLFELKGDKKYLSEAQRLARAAETHWIVPETGAVKDSGKFGHMLLEALLAVGWTDRDPHWLDIVRKSAAYVHESVRDPNGRYARRWDRKQTEALATFQLIDQASAARAFFVLAEALNKEGNTDR